MSKGDLVSSEILDLLVDHLKTLNPSASVALASAIGEGDEQMLGEGLRSLEPDDEVAVWQLFAPTKQPRHGEHKFACLSMKRRWIGLPSGFGYRCC